MATWLARVGAWSMRRAWLVVAAWVLLTAGVLGGAVALGPNMQESFEVPGTESQDALDRLGSVFPQVAGSSVQVVAQSGDGVEAHRAAIEEQAERMSDLDGVLQVVDPWNEFASNQISADGNTAYTVVQFEPMGGAKPDNLGDLVATADAARAEGLTVEFAGTVFQEQSVSVTWVEAVGVLFAGIVLVVTFWSLLAAGMPLVTALIGVAITMGGVLGASALATVSNSAPLMALMIGLAVGIDYALFILSRHRSQLARGMGVSESGSLAVGTSGTAVLFAGVTVIIALAGLLIVGIPFLSVMAIGAAASVAIAVAQATTLLPALMSIAGEMLRPKEGSRAARLASRNVDESPTTGMRWVTHVTGHPVLAIVAVIGAAVVLALPAASMQLALPDNGREPAGTTQRIANDMLQEAFGDGTTGPLVVMVDITQATDVFGVLEAISNDLAEVEGVDRIGSAFPSQGADTAIVQVIPETGPAEAATAEVVEALRAVAPDIEAKYNTPVAVSGVTAVQIDISQRLAQALVPFGIVVVSLAVLILMLVFRSLLVPITAALGFVLSVLAAFGATVAVFQWGWGEDLLHFEAGPILSFMPVLAMSVLFGLAMDYQMFLVAGMKEAYTHGEHAKGAVRHGFAANARVVTAAALIMFFVFFAFVPEGLAMIKAIAFALALGVAFDAFLVRMTLIPALMTLMGDAAWQLPRWLDRLLPNVDVEGESLERHRAALRWARAADGYLTLERFAPDGSGAGTPALAGARALWNAAVPKGAVAHVDAPYRERVRLAHALVGELASSGLARVGEWALPGDARAIGGAIARIDLDEVQRTPLEIVDDAVRYRNPFGNRSARRARTVAALDRAAEAAEGLRADRVRLARLDPLQRVAVHVVAALEGEAKVLWIDSAHGVPAGTASVAAALAPPEVTIVVGGACADDDSDLAGRTSVEIQRAATAEARQVAADPSVRNSFEKSVSEQSGSENREVHDDG